MRLTVIRNGPKRTILLAVGMGCYKWYHKRCVSKDTSPQGGGLWDPNVCWRENKAFLIKVWKLLPSIRVLKPWGRLLVVSLRCCTLLENFYLLYSHLMMMIFQVHYLNGNGSKKNPKEGDYCILQMGCPPRENNQSQKVKLKRALCIRTETKIWEQKVWW